ncbi:MAG: hypothetical protein ACRENC_07795, partial [Gemmatimonadaceae bacterium]
SDAVLQRMRRPERARTIRERVAGVREAVPELAIRTTCIVGFPGETADDFAQLCDLLEEVRFERVGAFTYSPQEGTRAAELADDVPMVVKLERLERLTELQRAITEERYERYVGRTVRAIVDRANADAATWQARLICQADDIDGITYLSGSTAPGAIVECRVDSVVDDYDFRAHVTRVLMPPGPAGRAARSRALPVLGGITSGSFGR